MKSPDCRFILTILLAAFVVHSVSAVEFIPLVDQVKPSILSNGGFEASGNGRLESWNLYGEGFQVAVKGGRNGSSALFLEATNGDRILGAAQTLILNQTRPSMVMVEAWSKAEAVTGSPDADYAVYVDVIYQDGTPLWAQTGCFESGTHDWQKKRVFILPEKPIRQLSVYCLFRHRQGRVWFDDVSCMNFDESATFFQGAWVKHAAWAKNTSDHHDNIPCGNWTFKMGEIPAFSANGTNNNVAAFLVRDVAANSGFHTFQGKTCDALHLSLQYQVVSNVDHVVVEGQLSDTSGKDRAVTLVFALPVDALGGSWGNSIDEERLIQGGTDYVGATRVNCGATGYQSLYPLGSISCSNAALALGLDLGQPAIHRISYHAGLKLLTIACDVALLPDTTHFPSSARFRFVLFPFDPANGFRDAWAKYMSFFPEYFKVRVKEQGIWMPFTAVETVTNWQDFGFKFHEGNNSTTFDALNGIYAFRYTEPMTWWMKMDQNLPRNRQSVIKARDSLLAGNEYDNVMARLTQTASMLNESGEPFLLFRNEPWCNGVVWSLNPNPYLPGETNFATYHWNEKIQNRQYGSDVKYPLAGEYLDSLEGYVTANLNYRREHFRYTTVPLTFDTDSCRPALFKGLAVYEFTRWLSKRVHHLDRLMFANSVPTQYAWLCPWLDVMGTETGWLDGQNYRPMSDADLCFRRALSGKKPYLFLMNVPYENFTHEMVEKYFQRSLAYGIFPSMFSHNAADAPYWQNPKWYNRDRDLFKHYIPLIRTIALAGWSPVPNVRVSNPLIKVERFGPTPDGDIYFTLHHSANTTQSVKIEVPLHRDWVVLDSDDKVTGKPFGQRIPSGWVGDIEKDQTVLLHGRHTQR